MFFIAALFHLQSALAQAPAQLDWAAQAPHLQAQLNQELEARGLSQIRAGNPQIQSEGDQIRIDLGSRDFRYKSSFLFDARNPPTPTQVTQAARMAAEDFQERHTRLNDPRAFQLRNAPAVAGRRSPTRSSSRALVEIGNGGGEARVGMGDVPYLSVWTQLPAIPGNDAQWLRTRVSIDGTLRPQSGPERAVLVTRVTTAVYSVEFQTDSPGRTPFHTTTRVELGVLDSALRISDQSVTGRIDIDPARLSHTGNLQLDRNVELYYQANLRVGMRVFEQSLPALRAVLGGDFRIGVLLYDHFFLEAGIAGATDFQGNDWWTFSGQIGWQFNENVRIFAGAAYTMNQDPMLMVPDGWSFFVGVSFRF